MTGARTTRSNAMRKIIEACLISADGIVLDDPFPFRDYLDDEVLRDRVALFEACDAVLWGRTTYERFSKRWSGGQAAPPYIARLSAMRNYVFSSKLETAEWNLSTLVRGDAAVEVTRLKKQDGGDLLILGHGLLGETLLKERLLDVLDLTIHPVLVGQGKPLFREGQTARLKLATTKSYSKLVKVTYEPQY
jgi:dihydrofolate reductase